MKIDEMVAKLDAQQLTTLRANAARLSLEGTGKRKAQATEALAVIDAESTRRASAESTQTKKPRSSRRSVTKK